MNAKEVNPVVSDTYSCHCRRVEHYPGLKNIGLGEGWRDGLAFCVLLHSYQPHLVDLNLVKPGDVLHNCALAFKAGEALGARALLDPHDLRDGKEVDKRSLLTYLASLHQVLEGKSGRGDEGDSGVSSSSSGQASPVGVGVVRRRRGEERKMAKEEGRRRVRSLCEGEPAGESAFLSAFRKFSSLTLSEGEIGLERREGMERLKEGRKTEEKVEVALKRVSSRGIVKEPQRSELVSRGCQTEESHLRSRHLWKRQPLTVKFAPSPTPSLSQSNQPLHLVPQDSIPNSPIHPPAPPQKQRLSLRLARIEAVRRRQNGSHLPFTSHNLQTNYQPPFNSQTNSHISFDSSSDSHPLFSLSSNSHLPFNSLPFLPPPPPPSQPCHQFSTLV